jgi:predicted transcriptional regulator
MRAEELILANSPVEEEGTMTAKEISEALELDYQKVARDIYNLRKFYLVNRRPDKISDGGKPHNVSDGGRSLSLI